MKIVVCIKQVPDTAAKIAIADSGKGISEAGLKFILNPYDEFAIEEALKTKEKAPGSEVIVISVGPKRVVETLRSALALGADKAVHITTDAALESGTTAKILAAKIKDIGAELVWLGKHAADDDSAAVGPMLAQRLGFAHVSAVSKLETVGEGAQSFKVERDIDGGSKEVWNVQCPLVLSATKGLNEPRYASLKGIMAAKSKPIETIEASSLANELQVVQIKKMWIPTQERAHKIFNQGAQQDAQAVAELLKNEAKVI